MRSSVTEDNKNKRSDFAKLKEKIDFEKVPRVWAVVYLLCLLVFEFAILLLDVLPVRMLAILFGVLFVVSAAIYYLLSSMTAKKWARVSALIMSVLLVFVYGFGTVHAVNTVSFMNKITAEPEEEVEFNDRVVTKPFNLYISGIDSWEKIDDVGRSDVNMLVTVNPETHMILLTSIPRDYKINIVGTEYTDKITHTGIHGIDVTLNSVEDLLDTRIDYYLKVNFNTVREFVDAIGGVDVVSEYAFTSHYGGDGKDYEFVEGLNHLNGAQALAFARERMSFLTGDHQRIKNQQLVFSAILDKTLKSTTILMRYSSILGSIQDYMETSMPARDMKSLIKFQMLTMEGWKVARYSLTGPGGREATYSGGIAYIMFHDEYSVETAKSLIGAVSRGETNLDQYYDEDYSETVEEEVIGGLEQSSAGSLGSDSNSESEQSDSDAESDGEDTDE
jgi:LCP family protein required for cell wall assembly